MKVNLSETITPDNLLRASKENTDVLVQGVASAVQLALTTAANGGLTSVTLLAADLGISSIPLMDQYALVEPTWHDLQRKCFFTNLNVAGNPTVFASLFVQWSRG